jgi:glutathione S-transferase
MSLRIAGRSSSHFTRVVRVFAHELGLAYQFEPVMDLLSGDSERYFGNPALRIPAAELDGAAWYGALNICRVLARRAPPPRAIVWPEALVDRTAANAQELVLQGMSTEVGLIMRTAARPDLTDRYDDKARASLSASLGWLEQHFASVRDALPADRALSFVEVTAFCFFAHLEFRQVVDMAGYPRLRAFCHEYELRPAARETAYRFDV